MANSQKTRKLPLCLRLDKAGGDWEEPLDVRDLATRLETEGVTDYIAKSEFGFESTWSMADAWLPKILNLRPEAEPIAPSGRSWRDYWSGISFALPLLCSCLSILLLDFSLWGGDLSAEEATAVGLGTVGSFFLSGGFLQVMSRRGLFFAGTKQFRRCEQSTWHWVRAGAVTLLLAGIAGLAVSTYWGLLPARLNLVAAGFCAALGLFWLATGVLYVLDRSLLILWVTLAGIATVATLYLVARLPLITAQFVAILVSSGAAFGMSARLLRRNREESPAAALRSTLLSDAFFLWPYFAYGVFYYVLLFADRLVAWTAGVYSSAFAVQFRGDYETALNLGLLAFVFQVGWVHQSTVAFYRELRRSLERFAVDRTGQFRRAMVRFYWSRIIRFAPFALLVSALSLLVAVYGGLLHGKGVAIAFWSLAGFPFLVVGLWNVSLLFGLSRAPKAASAASTCASTSTSRPARANLRRRTGSAAIPSPKSRVR